MNTPAEQKPLLSANMFYMWRCLLAIAWADGHCGDEELDYFEKLFDNLPRYYALTQEQRNVLADDLTAGHGQDVFALFSHINDPDIRMTLIGYAEDLAHLDGVLHPNEDDILKRLHLLSPATYDKEALRAEIHTFVAESRQRSADEKETIRQEIRQMHPFYDVMDRLLMRLGIDLIE